jgi:hypothetical protein
MATLTRPEWLPNPVTSLPIHTKVTFFVTPRSSAFGVQIEYRLSSPRLVFKPVGPNPFLPPVEAQGSSPVPAPVRREERVLVDRLTSVRSQKEIVRVLGIGQAGSEKPGIATLQVTVWDLDSFGSPANPMSKTSTIAFQV